MDDKIEVIPKDCLTLQKLRDSIKIMDGEKPYIDVMVNPPQKELEDKNG